MDNTSIGLIAISLLILHYIGYFMIMLYGFGLSIESWFFIITGMLLSIISGLGIKTMSSLLDKHK
jgi:hypothetical protein